MTAPIFVAVPQGGTRPPDLKPFAITPTGFLSPIDLAQRVTVGSTILPFKRKNSFETGTNGTAITNLNSGGANDDAIDSNVGTIPPSFTSTSPIHGTLSCHADATTATTSYLYWNWPAGAGPHSYQRVYIRVPNPIPAGTIYMNASKGSGNGNACQLRLNSAGKIELSNASDTVVATSTTVLIAGAVFRLEFHHFVSGTSGQLEARLFVGTNVEGTNPDEILGPVTTDTSTVIGQQRCGIDFRTVAASLDLDDWAVSNQGWIGPVPAAGGGPQSYTQTLTGALSFVGAMPRSIGKTVSGALNFKPAWNGSIDHPSIGGYAIGTDQDLVYGNASPYRYTIFQEYMYRTIASVRSQCPNIKIISYFETACHVTGYGASPPAYYPHDSFGVFYGYADANHPEWFLHLASNPATRAVYSDNTTYAAMDIGNVAYQNQWAANVIAACQADGFDGVWMDDVNVTPNHGLNGLLNEYTDTQYGIAFAAFVQNVGEQILDAGLLAFANVGCNPWTASQKSAALLMAPHLTAFNREFYTRYNPSAPFSERFNLTAINGTPPIDTMLQYDRDMQAQGCRLTGIDYATSPPDAEDLITMTYGRAAFLLAWDGRPGSAYLWRPDGNVAPNAASGGRWTINVGMPTGAADQSGTVWSRAFTRGLVYLNPDRTTTYNSPSIPAGYVDYSGTPVVGVVSMPPETALVLQAPFGSSLTGSLSFVGALPRKTKHVLAAALSFVGNLATSTGAHLFTQALTGSLSFVGSLPRTISARRTAALSFVGNQARAVAHGASASVGFSGALSRSVRTSLAGALSFAGGLTRLSAHALSASLTFSGAVSTAAVHVFTQALTASLSFVGSLPRQTRHGMTAGLSFVGSISRAIRTYLGGVLSFVGGQFRRTAHTESGGLSFVGSLARKTMRLVSGSLSFTGTMTTAAVHFFTQALSASLTFVGNLSTTKFLGRVLTATLSFTGTLPRRVGATKAATLSFTGSLPRRINTGLPAVLSFIGSLAKATTHKLAAGLSFVGTLTTAAVHFFTKSLTGGLSFVGTLTTQRVIPKLLTATLSFTGTVTRRTTHGMTAVLNFTGTLGRAIKTRLVATLGFVGNLTHVDNISALVTALRIRVRRRGGTLSANGQEGVGNGSGREGDGTAEGEESGT